MAVAISNNSSQGEELLIFKRSAAYVHIVFLSLLGLSVLIINTLIIWMLKADPHRSFNRPKIGLDLSNFLSAWLMGFLLVPVIIANEIINNTAQATHSQALRYFNYILTQFLLSNCMALNTVSIVEGVSGVINPHWSRKTFTRKNIRISLIVIFVVNIFYQCLLLFNISFKIHSIVFIHCFIIIPIIFDTCFFIRAYSRIRRPKSTNSIQDVPSAYTKEKRQMANMRNKKIARNFIKTIIAFFTPCVVTSIAYYIHMMVFFMYGFYEESDTKWRIVIGKITQTLLFVYPCFNPLAIVVRIPEYRSSIKLLLSRIKVGRT